MPDASLWLLGVGKMFAAAQIGLDIIDLDMNRPTMSISAVRSALRQGAPCPLLPA